MESPSYTRRFSTARSLNLAKERLKKTAVNHLVCGPIIIFILLSWLLMPNFMPAKNLDDKALKSFWRNVFAFLLITHLFLVTNFCMKVMNATHETNVHVRKQLDETTDAMNTHRFVIKWESFLVSWYCMAGIEEGFTWECSGFHIFWICLVVVMIFVRASISLEMEALEAELRYSLKE